MESLLGLGKVANPKQLQGPVLHGVSSGPGASGRPRAHHQGGERLQANGLGAGPLALPQVTGLEEGDCHGFALVAGAGEASEALNNLYGGTGAKTAGIEQQALTSGNPDQGFRELAQQRGRHDQDASTPEGRWTQ
jgi:hypothetical protein